MNRERDALFYRRPSPEFIVNVALVFTANVRFPVQVAVTVTHSRMHRRKGLFWKIEGSPYGYSTPYELFDAAKGERLFKKKYIRFGMFRKAAHCKP